ncbi:hypothetical protein GOODEAATRI_010492 [Goodea atripinnis]|uniref:DNA (cytosine-5-)-methyltransferase n=1 Tax=Goodea atripinnis TaxID=208336 RepID=A0ABV0N9L0_9TELE
MKFLNPFFYHPIRCFCVDCLDILVEPGASNNARYQDPWCCYMCQPLLQYGVLKQRHDWSLKLQEFFANDNGQEFVSPCNHSVFVLLVSRSGTIGRRALLCIKLASRQRCWQLMEIMFFLQHSVVHCWYITTLPWFYKTYRQKKLRFSQQSLQSNEDQSESSPCLTALLLVRKNKASFYIADSCIKPIQEWGPFDLVIGGSPCNDLSIVNPARKGLYEGTGRLFFEFYRLLSEAKPKEGEDRPFFWMFENVVAMGVNDKRDISRFLEVRFTWRLFKLLRLQKSLCPLGF